MTAERIPRSLRVEARREWDVLLLGGPAGTGKSSISRSLARRFGAGVTEVDDLVLFHRTLTTPSERPLLHFWDTDPRAATLTAEQIVEHTVEVARYLLPGVAAVIADHLEFRTPVVLEGDFLLPQSVSDSASLLGGRDAVRGVFLVEPDEAQIVANLLSRERQAGPQELRARVSWLYGRWLTEEAERRGLPVVPPRPWETLVERVRALSG